MMIKNWSRYSGTPRYNHPVNTTTSLLGPLYSCLKKKLSQTISYLKNPFNTTHLPWPKGGRVNRVPLYMAFGTKASASKEAKIPPYAPPAPRRLDMDRCITG